MSSITQVTDENFETEVLNSEQPVLLDFWAEWCGPCKMIAPILEEVAKNYQDQIKVAKMNIDNSPDTPAKYGVRGIPTLLILKNGDVHATKVGALTKSQLTSFIEEAL